MGAKGGVNSNVPFFATQVACQVLRRSHAVGMWSVSYSAKKRNRKILLRLHQVACPYCLQATVVFSQAWPNCNRDPPHLDGGGPCATISLPRRLYHHDHACCESLHTTLSGRPGRQYISACRQLSQSTSPPLHRLRSCRSGSRTKQRGQ